MRLLLTCLLPRIANPPIRINSFRQLHLLSTMVTSPPQKQVKLDAFVKSSSTTKGKGKGKETISNGAGSSSFSTTNGKNTSTKRPRDDGTDIPASAKKSKASGTYRAFPNGNPDPAEDTVEGLTSILAKLEQVQKKASPIKVGPRLDSQPCCWPGNIGSRSYQQDARSLV